MVRNSNSGRENQRKKQAGEYIVAAELCRRSFFATTFTGNMPDFDILAIDDFGNSKKIQVKTKTTDNWNLNANKFLEIEKIEDKTNIIQRIVGFNKSVDTSIIFVFIDLNQNQSQDAIQTCDFFLIKTPDLQKIMRENYENHLEKHGGVRPKNSKSVHTKVTKEDLIDYRDNWKILYT